MTTSKAQEVEKRRQRTEVRPVATNFLDDLLYTLDDLIAEQDAERESRSRVRFPSVKYRDDPVSFCVEILGVEPWWRQVELLEMIRDHKRVACSSGHKIGKSTTLAIAALWFYCSFPDARVVMSSTTARQVDQILWREVKMLRVRGGRCVSCKREDPEGHRILRPCPHSAEIDGNIGELARTGLKSVDFREIVGFTAKEAEAVAGVSGKNLLYLLDEASGIPDEIFQAVEGNRAAGARIVLMSNPTRTTGEFYLAFGKKAEFYRTLRISSEETPNAVEGRDVIPGLAGREWIEEKKREWGEDSPLYKVRVRGEFAESEDGKIFSIHAIEQAEQRWKDFNCADCSGGTRDDGRACTTCDGSGRKPIPGRLFIGIDPAGPSGSGDETVFALRRGSVILKLLVWRGLDEAAILVHLLSTISVYALKREVPVVIIDREGSVGAALYGHMRSYVDRRDDRAEFEMFGVKASSGAVRKTQVYDRMRDELTGNFELWIREGGAIPEDAKLAGEMHELEWITQVNGKQKVTRKDAIKKELGRSPDRYDACVLSCWEPMSLREDENDDGGGTPGRRSGTDPDDDDHGGGGPMDPYAGSPTWGGR